MKKGILLINLGTPDSPSVRDVRRFLRQFLMDPLVIDLPFLARWVLVNCVIAPFRGPKSAKEYQLLWTKAGSPLKVHTNDLTESLQKAFHHKITIVMAMRYQNPDIASGLEQLKKSGCEEILILPLFPQYAEATTQSVFNKVSAELKKMRWSVSTTKILSFATDKGYINALVSNAEQLDLTDVDHTVLSYHGLPERQLKKLNADCLTPNCCDQLTEKNKNCYKAQCYATSRAIAEKMGLTEKDYSVCFQSRQGKIPWTSPYVDELITDLAAKGDKNIRVFSPAFVADCLETTIEIGYTYRNLFKQLGGNELHLVPGLNHSKLWVQALQALISKSMDLDDVQ